MTYRIEPSRVEYHGLSKHGGWDYTRHELEPFTIEAPESAGIEEIEMLVRRKHLSATWYRAFEILPDGSEHWLVAGSL